MFEVRFSEAGTDPSVLPAFDPFACVEEALMKLLICLDCDGTLFTTESLIPPVRVAQRPIPLSRLEALAAAGAQLVIVSPSSACDGLPYPRITHPDRAKALLEAAGR